MGLIEVLWYWKQNMGKPCKSPNGYSIVTHGENVIGCDADASGYQRGTKS